MRQVAPFRQQDGKRAFRRAFPVLVLAVCAAWAPVAHGHAIVQPGASRPAEQQVYTLTVPNERGSNVVSVSLQVPPGVESLLVRKAPGWKVRLARQGDRVAVVQWSGNRIGPEQYDSFQFIARNPVREGELVWKVIQRYTNATDRWIGPADSEFPAARTRISESAVPVDAINTEEAAPAAAETPSTPAPAAKESTGGGDDSSDTLSRIVAFAALAAAVAALAFAARRRRS